MRPNHLPMRIELARESRVLIDLRATGLLRAVGHNPTLTVRPEPWSTEVTDGAAMDLAIDLRFAATAIEPPSDMGAADRDKMRENLRGRDVLDAARFPEIELHGRYAGTLEGGRFSGDLHVRGAPRPISMAVRGKVSASGGGHAVEVRGEWEGRLTDLGLRPYRALLGALKLEDWVRLRLEAELSVR